MISIQLFDRFTEQRRLNLRRLIRLGFAGRSSQINGILLRQSNIFQDFSDVNATQPRRVPSLKFIILFVLYLELMKKIKVLLQWIIWCPSSVSIAFYWNVSRIDEIPFRTGFTQANERMTNWNFAGRLIAISCNNCCFTQVSDSMLNLK